jgi:integrase
VSQRFDRQVARVGLPPVRFTDLRHTHATLHLLAGDQPMLSQCVSGIGAWHSHCSNIAHVLP